MQSTSAPTIAPAADKRGLGGVAVAGLGAAVERADAWLDAERDQLPLWFVIGFGGGIGAWLTLPGAVQWAAFLCLAAGLGLAGWAARGRRTGSAAAWFGLALALGCVTIWLRSESVSAPRIDRPRIAAFDAQVEQVETLVARDSVRITLAPTDPALPPRLRVSLAGTKTPPGLAASAMVRLRARLTPPPPMPLPGGHDFARDAWFRGIGGTGRVLGPLTVTRPVVPIGLDAMRDRLGRHIRDALPGPGGAIATALATGDQAALNEDDADAMRRSGLTHLLSVSGLHIAAMVGAAMFLTLRLLALSERLALRFNLVLVAAGAGALAGIAYTVLTGAQVPTVRSCIAALLVLAGMAMGREALSLRLIAVAALLILVFRPEALAGASFQLSFAAVTSIVLLHSSGFAQRHFSRREEGLAARLLRSLGAMVGTGLAVELALMPLALYHFHRAGLYGVAANIIAIPLTTFVIMPLEGLALLLDTVGLAGPAWQAAGLSLDLLLGLARRVSSARGAVATLPAMPSAAFAAMVIGGVWLAAWRGRARLLGVMPLALGAAAAAATPAPDLLVTGDGRHLAIIDGDGAPVLLRERSGDFIRSILSEASGFDGDPLPFDSRAGVRCSRDSCVADIDRGGRRWRLLATRSSQNLDWRELVARCAEADIAVSDRGLPRGCAPRWLRLDRFALLRTGGVAIRLGEPPRVDSVAARIAGHPWAPMTAVSNSDKRPRSTEGSLPCRNSSSNGKCPAPASSTARR